jgi:DNA helicase-2/ATP-dependent DNA helicase PcrA
MDNFLSQLNLPQRKAVERTEGPLLILAGAGSGKTRVITYRIAHLIRNLDVDPWKILAVTFTNKAAAEMKERVAALLPESADSSTAHISTFHSFCVRVLRRGAERLGYTHNFSIYDDDDQQRVVRASVKELGLSESMIPTRMALSRISHAKNSGWSPENLFASAQDPDGEKLAQVYARYVRKLQGANALDFDDLLLKTVELFERAPDFCEEYNRRFAYLMVDEYQDTNRIQYRLIRHLTRSHDNICVVGDEDQSIYRWRGADIANILSFEKDYPRAHVIRLEQNYRSTQIILDAASAVVGNNRDRIGKNLWSEKTEGASIGTYEAGDPDQEAEFIAAEAASALGENAEATVAVLYRTNAQSRALEEAFRRRNLRYQVVGGFRFYERAEVKDAIAYARLAVNPQDSAALLRIINVPPRGLGTSSVAALQSAASQLGSTLWDALEHVVASRSFPARALDALEGFSATIRELMLNQATLPPSRFLRSILDSTGYIRMLEAEDTPESQGRTENLQELVNAAKEAEARGQTLRDFLDYTSLVSDTDDFHEKIRATLMTLHTAKGLEFSTVFLAGMEEGLFPHKLSLEDNAAIEEERRLCYVGMTRAKHRLVLTRALRRRQYGEDYAGGTQASRFLREIPRKLLSPARPEMPLFKARTSWNNSYNSVESIHEFFQERGPALRSPISHPPRAFRTPVFEQSTRKLAGTGTSSAGAWKLGSRVRHPRYGVGTVVDCEGNGPDAKLTISFPGYGRKKMIERYAQLESA